MYKYDITINDCHQSLNYVNKRKSLHMTMTVPILMIHVLQVLLESYVMIEILIIIQKIIDSCSEFIDFLKAVCTR